MRKIYQSAPDVSQAVANKAIEIIERQFAVNGVRRAEDLPEEGRVRLLRELEGFFAIEVRLLAGGKEGVSARRSRAVRSIYNWLVGKFRSTSGEGRL